MCADKDSKFFVYLHRRSSDDKVFYIGKGTGRRFSSVKSRNPHWHNVAKKHGWYYEIVFENLSHQEALDLERETISEMTYFCEPLTNMNGGGTGFAGFSMPEDVKAKISKAVKKSFLDEKRKETHRISVTGRRWSEESKREFSKSKESRKKHKWESLETGDVHCLTQAEARKQLGLTQTQTSALVNQKVTIANGWKIYGTLTANERARRLVVDTSSGDILNVSQKELIQMGLSSACASRLFSGKKDIAGGFVLLDRVDSVLTVAKQIEIGLLAQTTIEGKSALLRLR